MMLFTPSLWVHCTPKDSVRQSSMHRVGDAQKMVKEALIKAAFDGKQNFRSGVLVKIEVVAGLR